MTNDNRRANTKKAIQERYGYPFKDQKVLMTSQQSKLAKEAGISRSSFYTHYKDKFELIDSCQRTLFNQVEYIFEKHEGNKETSVFGDF